MFLNNSELETAFTHVIGDVSSLVEVTVQMPNFTLNFDDDETDFNDVNVIINRDSGFLGFGADMTGVDDYIELGIVSYLTCTYC